MVRSVAASVRMTRIKVSKESSLELSIVAIAAIFFVFTTLKYFRGVFVDDSYVFSRYAQNLASGHGLVWTVGEHPVEGFTSILWVLLIACASRLSGASVVSAAVWLGVGFGVIGLFLSWNATRLAVPKELRPFSVAAPLILAANPFYARHATSGMETSLDITLVLLMTMLWAWDEISIARRLPYLTAISFLAFLARPDALLLCAMGTVWITLSSEGRTRGVRELALKYALPLLIAISLYAIVKLEYFGSVIPLPAYMKVRPLEIYSNLHLVNFVLGHELAFVSNTAALSLTAIIPALLEPRRTSRLVWAIFGTTILFMGYLLFVLPVMSFESRFYCPLLGPLAVASALGLAQIAGYAREPGEVAFSTRASVIVLIVVIAAELGMMPTVSKAAMLRRPIYNEAIGRTLSVFPGISVAGSESGAIPYFAGGRFLDLGGLNDAFVARNRFKPDMTRRFRDYLVSTFGLPDVYIDAFPEYDYALMASQPEIAVKYGAPIEVRPYKIYVRQDAPARAAIIQRLQQLSAE
jgi:arabinofuranosyltransferase